MPKTRGNVLLERRIRSALRRMSLRKVNVGGHLAPNRLKELRRAIAGTAARLRSDQETARAQLLKGMGKPPSLAEAQGRGYRDLAHWEASAREQMRLLEHHLSLLTEPRLGYLPLMYQDLAIRALESELAKSGQKLPASVAALHERVRSQMTHVWSLEGMREKRGRQGR